MIEPHLGSSSGELSHRFCMLTSDAAHTVQWLAQPPPAWRASSLLLCFSGAYSAYLSKDCIYQLNVSAESTFSRCRDWRPIEVVLLPFPPGGRAAERSLRSPAARSGSAPQRPAAPRAQAAPRCCPAPRAVRAVLERAARWVTVFLFFQAPRACQRRTARSRWKWRPALLSDNSQPQSRFWSRQRLWRRTCKWGHRMSMSDVIILRMKMGRTRQA